MGLLLLLGLAGCSRAPGAAGREEAPAPERPQEPVVTIAAAVDSVNADGPLQFLVHATPAPRANLTVGVSIASDPCNITRAPDTVTIAAGESRASLTVGTSGAAVGAQGCVVTATIAAGDGYRAGAAANASASATLMLVQPVVTIAAGDSPVTEGDAVTFTLTAAPPPASPLTVDVSWAESGSFLTPSRPQTATIPASGTATLTADTVDDGTDELDGSVTATVAPGSGYTVGSTDSATVEVTDNDPPAPRVPVVTAKADSEYVCEGADAVFTLTATPAPASSLTVHFSLFYSKNGRSFTQIPSPVPYSGTVSISSSGMGTYRMATVDNDVDFDFTWILLRVDHGAGYVPGAHRGLLIGVRVIVVDSIHCSTSTTIEGASPPGTDVGTPGTRPAPKRAGESDSATHFALVLE